MGTYQDEFEKKVEERIQKMAELRQIEDEKKLQKESYKLSKVEDEIESMTGSDLEPKERYEYLTSLANKEFENIRYGIKSKEFNSSSKKVRRNVVTNIRALTQPEKEKAGLLRSIYDNVDLPQLAGFSAVGGIAGLAASPLSYLFLNNNSINPIKSAIVGAGLSLTLHLIILAASEGKAFLEKKAELKKDKKFLQYLISNGLYDDFMRLDDELSLAHLVRGLAAEHKISVENPELYATKQVADVKRAEIEEKIQQWSVEHNYGFINGNLDNLVNEINGILERKAIKKFEYISLPIREYNIQKFFEEYSRELEYIEENHPRLYNDFMNSFVAATKLCQLRDQYSEKISAALITPSELEAEETYSSLEEKYESNMAPEEIDAYLASDSYKQFKEEYMDKRRR